MLKIKLFSIKKKCLAKQITRHLYPKCVEHSTNTTTHITEAITNVCSRRIKTQIKAFFNIRMANGITPKTAKDIYHNMRFVE